jgi:hypothetical protein
VSYRALISLTNGRVSVAVWSAAMRQEAPVKGSPKACAECPLRRGGVMEDGAATAISQASPKELKLWQNWGCHASNRPCAGMRRLLRAALDEPDEVRS